VAGGPDEREPAPLDRLERTARGEQGGVPARLRGDCVGVEQGRRLDRGEPVEISGLVTALYLFTRGGSPVNDVEGFQQGFEARTGLDVRLRRMELREARVAYELDRTASESVSRLAESWARPTR
jgi:hypothetical protein